VWKEEVIIYDILRYNWRERKNHEYAYRMMLQKANRNVGFEAFSEATVNSTLF
jgi:hypothetical protein